MKEIKKLPLEFTLTHTGDLSAPGKDPIKATVPGAVQLDYGNAFGYGPYYYGLNFRKFEWMEDEYFIYSAPLRFECAPTECAVLRFEGLDYSYEIRIDGRVAAKGEGMFSPVSLDVTPYSGKDAKLEVVLFPIPKCPGAKKRDRSEARASCKPASSYGWDWHPRLVPTGIWKEAYLAILPIGSPHDPEVSYRLTEKLDRATVDISVGVTGMGTFVCEIKDPEGKVVAREERVVGEKQTERFTLTVESPRLWYPRGYGEQPVYVAGVRGATEVTRKLGFRRSKLVRNADDVKRFEAAFPKSALPAPATLEINGVKIFAKGSNLVNTEIFPALMTEKRYDELLSLAYGANMNILRMWGGQFINHEYFYDRCDELGIMIWQEFPLSCNLHPDDDAYLEVLKKEAVTIIKRLRTHPCLAFWAGGNELFNSWSGMTVQSLPLRLLDSLCYEHDRHTPFNMTSPLHGMAHGTYVKVQVTEGSEDPNVDDVKGEEFIEVLKRSDYNTYTEFGCNGGADPEYIKKYIMSEEDYENCDRSNEVWVEHHAFNAWLPSSWLGKAEVKYYFGGWNSVNDLMEKTLWLQSMAYKSMFEEMRRKAPHCSMAVNWDFNEPWPCAAGNSLVNWPAEPKPALKSVGEALRPVLMSLSAQKNRYLTGEVMDGEVWVLNDSPETVGEMRVKVTLCAGSDVGNVKAENNGKITKTLCEVTTECAAPRSNVKCGGFSFVVPEELPERFTVSLECEGHPEYDSVYSFVHRSRQNGAASD